MSTFTKVCIPCGGYGGGYCLWTGCAAVDTGASMIFKLGGCQRRDRLDCYAELKKGLFVAYLRGALYI